MDNKINDGMLLTYLTTFLIVFSLTYYFGFFYGLGISPSSLPITLIDITNGIIANLPLTLVIMIITLWKFIHPNNSSPVTSSEKVERSNVSSFFNFIKNQTSLYVIFFIITSIIAYRGVNPLLYMLGFLLSIKIIESLPEPEWIDAFFTRSLKLVMTILVIIFSIGFISGCYKFYSKINYQIVTLTNSQKYTCNILVYLSSGLLIKNTDKIIFFNNLLIKSIEYIPSKSYLEAKAEKVI